MAEEQLALKKSLLKKDKLELVKILKGQKQPTNGSKADLVDRILAHDEKTGGAMAAAANEEAGSPVPADDGGEDDGVEEAMATAAQPKKRKKSKPKSPRTPTSDDEEEDEDEEGGGGPGIECHCAGGGARPDCDGGVAGIAQIATALAAIGQFLLGILQFVQMAPTLEVCDDSFPGVDCVGDSLYWDITGVDETSSGLNVTWRSVFTLRPSYFFANWTPMLFACIAVMQFFPTTSWYLVSGTWVRCFFFHTFMFLFAAFGYCGQAGVIIAFVEVFAAAMCLIMAMVTRNGGGTYLTFNFCG